MSHASVLGEVKRAVNARNTEEGERSAVMAVLAKHGHAARPEVYQGTANDGRAVRIYVWHDTPAGSFALITGPDAEGEVSTLSDLSEAQMTTGFYIEALPAGTRVTQRTKEAFDSVKRRFGVSETKSKPAPKKRSARKAPMPEAAPAAPSFHRGPGMEYAGRYGAAPARTYGARSGGTETPALFEGPERFRSLRREDVAGRRAAAETYVQGRAARRPAAPPAPAAPPVDMDKAKAQMDALISILAGAA